MKKHLLFLLFFYCTLGFAQKGTVTKEGAQKKVYEYVLEHLVQFKKETKLDTVFVKIFFKENYQLDKVSFYKFDRALSGEYENEAEIEVPYYLDTIIKQYFAFFNHNFFSNQRNELVSFSFAIPFSEKHLKEAIANVGSFPPDRKVSYNINPNTTFILKINKLSFTGATIINKTLSGKLNHLSCEPIEITPSPNNLFIVFRAINTSHFRYDKEVPLTYLEYKLIYKNGNTVYQVAYGRQTIENKKVNITEIPEYGSGDLLDDYYCPKTDEDGNEIVDYYELKGLTFNFDILFE